MENQKANINLSELLSTNIRNNPSRFLELLEYFDSSIPTRETALIIKKAMAVQSDPILSFLLKKSFRLAAFKLKGAAFKVSLAGLDKLLRSPDRLDDLALAITSIEKAEAFMASDFFKSANWKEFPSEILPCFCLFFKNHGNSQDLDDLLEMTRHPSPIVIAAAVEAIKKLDTGTLKSIIQPLLAKTSDNNKSEAIEQLYLTNASFDLSNISNKSRSYYVENHKLLIDSLKAGTSALITIRILRLIKKYGSKEDAEYVKPFLTKDDPDIVRAAIKALVLLDPEYLCIYLPQLLQDNNSKVRVTAARAFQSIDKESVEEIVLNFLNSLNVKQRSIGITTAMLVDFNVVRDAFLSTFAKETNPELLEQIGLVLAANPDRELIKDLYFVHANSKTILKAEREKIIDLCSEKVSIALGGNPWPKELLFEAKKLFEEYQNNPLNQANNNNSQSSNNSDSTSIKNNQSQPKTKLNSFYKNVKIKQDPPKQRENNVSFWVKLKNTNLKTLAMIAILILIPLLWGIVIVLLVMKYMF